MQNEEKILRCAKFLNIELKKRIGFHQVGDRITVPQTCQNDYVYAYCHKVGGMWQLFDPFTDGNSFMLIINKVHIFNVNVVPETGIYEFSEPNSKKVLTSSSNFREGLIDFFLIINENKERLENLIC